MAVYTSLDYTRLRNDTGNSATTMPDADAEAILVQSAELYTGVKSRYAGARVIALSQLVSSSAKMSSYKQNSTTENLSEVFDHLLALLKYWQGVLDKAIVDEGAVTASTRDASLRIQVVSSW